MNNESPNHTVPLIVLLPEVTTQGTFYGDFDGSAGSQLLVCPGTNDLWFHSI